MIIYITGAPGVGKSNILNNVSIKNNVIINDLDIIFDNNCKKYSIYELVQEGCKKDIEEIIKNNTNIIFVGYQEKEQLFFTPDVVILLVRTDYEYYYREKMLKDYKFLCEHHSEYENIIMKTNIDELPSYFIYNEIVKMRSLQEFIDWVQLVNKVVLDDFPNAKMYTFSEVIEYINKLK
jgi:hypothetical protein